MLLKLYFSFVEYAIERLTFDQEIGDVDKFYAVSFISKTQTRIFFRSCFLTSTPSSSHPPKSSNSALWSLHACPAANQSNATKKRALETLDQSSLTENAGGVVPPTLKTTSSWSKASRSRISSDSNGTTDRLSSTKPSSYPTKPEFASTWLDS